MKTGWAVVLGGAAVIAAQGVTGLGVYFAFDNWAVSGQFGDVFGVANTLFSGLAFAGLIYTITLQRQELALQREELRLTRNELSRTAKAQEQSEEALRAQAGAAQQSARLGAMTYLIERYSTEADALGKSVVPAGDPIKVRRAELNRRREVLLDQLDSMYQQLTEEDKHAGSIQAR